MTIREEEKIAIEEVMNTILSCTSGRRNLAQMFRRLPDGDAWKEYYKVIPEPRCLDDIKSDLAEGKYASALDVLSDLTLVFSNALYFNEDTSVISKDAQTLKDLMTKTWNASLLLPQSPLSPIEDFKPHLSNHRTPATPSSYDDVEEEPRGSEGRKDRKYRTASRASSQKKIFASEPHMSSEPPVSPPQMWTGPAEVAKSTEMFRRHLKSTDDRSVISAAGGMAGLGVNPSIESLPHETTLHFDSDPLTHRQLWFSGPPFLITKASTIQPQFSLEYLAFCAQKSKMEDPA